MSFLVGKPNRLFTTSLSSFFKREAEQSKRKFSIMNTEALILYGDPTPSDINFLISDSISFLSSNSSTRSDAESAPSDFGGLLERISNESIMWIERSGRQLPPEWNMPDLVRAVIFDDRIDIPGFLTSEYYDLMLHGPNSWLCQEIFEFLDLINYVF